MLIPDPYAAPIVLRMFEMAADGESVTNIVKWLNSSKILPPMRHFQSIGTLSENDARRLGHIHWGKSRIYAILNNRVYCGDMVQGKSKTKSYDYKHLPEDDWIVVEDTHEAIVSRELFEKVQRRWSTSSSPPPLSPTTTYKLATTPNIFLRLIFCGHCELAMRRHRTTEVKYRFMCDTRRIYDEGDCVLVSINEDALKVTVLELLNKHTPSTLAHATKTTKVHESPEKAKLQKLQSELNKNSHFLQSLYESRTQGDITSDEFRSMKASYETKIAELKSEEKKLRNEMLSKAAKEAEASKAAAQLDGVRRISDLTAETLKQLVKKIVVYEDKQVDLHFVFSDEVASVKTNAKAAATNAATSTPSKRGVVT